MQDECRQQPRINMAANGGKVSKSKTHLIRGRPSGLLISMALNFQSGCRRTVLHVEKPALVFLNSVLHS